MKIDDEDDGEEMTPDIKEVEEAFDREEDICKRFHYPTCQKMKSREHWLRNPRAARIAVRKLRRQFGHCPNRVLVEILRSSGAKADPILAARLLRCEGCDHERPQAQTSKGALRRTRQFSESVGIDIFEVKDTPGTRYTTLSFLCMGATFHQAAVIQSATAVQPASKQCLKIFLEKKTWGKRSTSQTFGKDMGESRTNHSSA